MFQPKVGLGMSVHALGQKWQKGKAQKVTSGTHVGDKLLCPPPKWKPAISAFVHQALGSDESNQCKTGWSISGFHMPCTCPLRQTLCSCLCVFLFSGYQTTIFICAPACAVYSVPSSMCPCPPPSLVKPSLYLFSCLFYPPVWWKLNDISLRLFSFKSGFFYNGFWYIVSGILQV